MLPIDFKSALVKEKSLRSVYLHSQYGASIVYDLYHFLEKKWKLNKKSTQISKECEKEIRNIDCYFQLLKELVNQYRGRCIQLQVQEKIPRDTHHLRIMVIKRLFQKTMNNFG